MLKAQSLTPQAISELIRLCIQMYGAQTPETEASDFQDGALLAAVQFLMLHSREGDALAEMGIPIWRAYVLLSLACDKAPNQPHICLALAATSFLLGKIPALHCLSNLFGRCRGTSTGAIHS